jgi:signal transduction histidine kinase
MRNAVAVAAAALVVLTFDLGVAAAWGTADHLRYGIEFAYALVWIAVGVAASRIRPNSRLGLKMNLFGLLLACNAPASFGLVAGTGPNVLQTVATTLVAPQPALVAHTMLSYPDGRVRDRVSRLLLTVTYVFAALDSLRVLVAAPTPGIVRNCADRCAANPVQLVREPLVGTLETVARAGWLVLGVLFVAVLGHRLVRSSPRERRVHLVPLTGAFVTALAFIILGLAGSTTGGTEHIDGRTLVIQLATVAGIPVAFLIGLLRERLSHAQVADLVRALERAPLDGLDKRVARALGDPSALVVFPLPDGCVDAAGRPVALPVPTGKHRVTPLGDGEPPLALLVHDRQLEQEPRLLAAAGAATRLAVENARLHAQVQAQLVQVRASRARLVAAADAERRRLERDLHDGAQQRLLALGVVLRLLSRRLPDEDRDLAAAAGEPSTAELLAEAQTELCAAVDELRDLARGIHPAVLTDQGLPAAVQQLATRSPVPVTLHVGLERRLVADVESTAYFVVSEGLTNAAKHAAQAQVTVTITEVDGGLLRVTVADDGPGGADPTAGSGLRGLADRVASIDGRLTVTSPLGRGTTLTAELPLCGPANHGT